MTDRACKLTARISDPAAFDRLVPELERAFSLARYENMPYAEIFQGGSSKADGIRILLKNWKFLFVILMLLGMDRTTWKCYNMYSTERR